MKESDPLLSLHMSRELGRRSGSVTEDTARWNGLVLFRKIPYIANLTSYGRDDYKLPTSTVRLVLDRVQHLSEEANNKIAIDIFEHHSKYVHIARKVFLTRGEEETYLPVHWGFYEPRITPGPILVRDIDTIHHSQSHLKYDREEFRIFWELSQTLKEAC